MRVLQQKFGSLGRFVCAEEAMNYGFDTADYEAVADALREWQDRCKAIIALLANKKTLSRYERAEATELYTSLKNDLKEAAKRGTLSGRREPMTRAESAFYDPAVRKAHIAMRPKTNSHPLTNRWLSAMFETEGEFSYVLHQMDRAQER
jgi:hypothetical protein